MFNDQAGFCRVCGRRWGRNATPLRELRGSLETSFLMDVDHPRG